VVLTVPATDRPRDPEAEAPDVLLTAAPARKSPPPLPVRAAPPPPDAISRRPLPAPDPPEPVPEVSKKSSKPRRRTRRDDERRGQRIASERGSFGSVNAGVIGGILMMLIAVVWFIGGLAVGYIFYYPPVLLVIGFIAMIKGFANRN
jgi:hypothetical protein